MSRLDIRQTIEGVRGELHKVRQAQGRPRLSEEEALTRYVMQHRGNPRAILDFAGGDSDRAIRYEKWAEGKLQPRR